MTILVYFLRFDLDDTESGINSGITYAIIGVFPKILTEAILRERYKKKVFNNDSRLTSASRCLSGSSGG